MTIFCFWAFCNCSKAHAGLLYVEIYNNVLQWLMERLVFEYQLNVSSLVCFHMHYICECGCGCYICKVWHVSTLWEVVVNQRALTAQWVHQAVQPVDQVNPSSRRDTTGCDCAGVATDSGPYPDEACQGTQAYLAGDGEEEGGTPRQGEVALVPHSTSPHGDPAWTCKVGRKLPSCLGEEGEERTTTYPCISDMQLNNMHYYCTQCPFSHMHLQLLML